jgi:hypothetical protein
VTTVKRVQVVWNIVLKWLVERSAIVSNIKQKTEGGWIRLTITKWKLQPVLDVTKLNEDCVRRLVAVFDKYCEKDLRRLPKQFDPGNIDPVRRGIDREFLEALDVEFYDEELDDLYRLIYQNLTAWIGER